MIKWLLSLFKKKPVVPRPIKPPTPPVSKEDLVIFCWYSYKKALDQSKTWEDMICQSLTRAEIEDIGRKIYKVELDRRFSKPNMLKQLKELYKGEL